MREKLNLAVIGTGRWGKNIIKTLELFSWCSVAYTANHNYHTLLKKEDIDAVLIATPAETHMRVALPFIQKRVPVFIEKPFTTNLKDAKRLARASQKAKTPIFVGHIHLYNPAYHAVKKCLKQIGKIRFVTCEGANYGPFRGDVSALWDWAPHDISVVLDLLDSMPKMVQAWGVSVARPKTTLYDVVYAKLSFSHGVSAFIFSSYVFPEKRKRITIVGDKGSIVFDDTASRKVTLYKKIKNKLVVSYPQYDAMLSLTNELKEFLSVVRWKNKFRTDVNEGVSVVRVLDAAEKSIKKGGSSIKITGR